MTEFYDRKLRADIAAKGFIVDEEGLALLKSFCKANGLKQKQFDELAYIHLDSFCRVMNRRNFGFGRRILVALYWLGFGKVRG